LKFYVFEFGFSHLKFDLFGHLPPRRTGLSAIFPINKNYG